MKNLKYLILFCLITLLGCDDFGNLNDDPNNATQVDPSTLLSRAQYMLYNRVHGRNLNAEWGMLMVQYWAQNEYTEESRYDVDENTFNTSWEILYTEVLKELETAKTLVENQEIPESVKTNQKNIIKVMQVQAYAFLTDGFGPIPYSESLDDLIDLPAYDDQSDIYNGMLQTLMEASNSFDTSSISFNSGDIIYDGQVDKWVKLTNSLMLRLAMRIVDVDQSTASTYISAALSNLIDNSEDNAIFTFTTTLERANPLYRDVVEDSRDDFCVSEYLVQRLTETGDPRLEKFAKESAGGGIVGMPYGLSDNDATLLKPTTSRPNDLVRSATSPHPIITLAEVNFLKAEVYQRGLANGDAEESFNAGIEASMGYWGITDATLIENYIAANPYDASNWKESIGWQKWVSLYMNGLEAWSEWRRLDYPQLEVPEVAVVNSIPTKLPYPNSEISNNSSQLERVTSDPTNITQKVWWDIN